MVKLFNQDYGALKSHKQTNQYHVYKVVRSAGDITLHCFWDAYSSSHIKDQSIFEAFANKYEVISGGWYGNHGRWRTLKRIVRQIKCKNVTEFKETGDKNGNEINYYKPAFSNTITVTVKSEKVGELSYKCTEVDFTDLCIIMLFDKIRQVFVDATNDFNNTLIFSGTV